MTTWTGSIPVPDSSASFEDASILQNVTKVREVHLRELRDVLKSLHNHYHVFDGSNSNTESPSAQGTFTEDPVTADVTQIKASHWLELRTACENFATHNHYVPSKSMTSSSFTVSAPPVLGWSSGMAISDPPRKPHIDELRAILQNFHSHTHTICCNSECGCNGTCGCQSFCGEDCCSQCWAFD